MRTPRLTTRCNLLGSSFGEGQTTKEAAGLAPAASFFADGNRLHMTIRALALVSAASLFLAGCGGSDQQANNTVNIDQAVLSDELAANDVTAIDAVTGDAANMAADVDINFTNAMLDKADDSGSKSDSATSRPRSKAPASTTNSAAPAAEPATNTATGNTTE